MRNTLKTAALVLALAAPASPAEELTPDALVKTISADVLAAIRQDKDIQAGNPKKIASLVEAKILPHFDFAHTTRIAMGANWRRASPEQREQLVREFRTLLVRTYSSALASFRDQVLEFKPLRAQPGDMQVTVRSEVRQSGTQAVSIDYDMEKTASGWKVYDVKISGASLAATYRDTFAEEVRNHGIEGLIDSLSNKNRHNDARPASINT
ncbi:MAG: ABC transporter substrate-binding protein [Betaproteobacteria bacterium]|nr:MAG: ABC transporter substrate-binding protein [Betaproteobacteria bacterium]